jgi:hypothetical protein
MKSSTNAATRGKQNVCCPSARPVWLCRQAKIAALADQGRQRDAEAEARLRRAQAPEMRAESFAAIAPTSAALLEKRCCRPELSVETGRNRWSIAL